MRTIDGFLILILVSFISLLSILGINDSFNRAIASVNTISSEPISLSRASSLVWRNGINSAPWQARDSQYSYIFNNELYIGGGLNASNTFTPLSGEPIYEKAEYYNDLWKTKDGINWTLVTSSSTLPKIRSASVVNFNGELYLYNGWGPDIGMNSSVYSSKDGINWYKLKDRVDFEPREGQRMLVKAGKIYMFGGVSYFSRKTFNDVWVSSDGINFEELTPSAPWSGRWDHDVTYYKGKFWLAGGMNLNMESFNDVWSSVDGKFWQLETAHADFSQRQGHVLLVHKDIIYLIGGLNADTNEGVGDTWFTKNGKDWFKTSILGDWIGREDHQALEFNNKLIILGGMDSNWKWRNDVWISSFNNNNND